MSRCGAELLGAVLPEAALLEPAALGAGGLGVWLSKALSLGGLRIIAGPDMGWAGAGLGWGWTGWAGLELDWGWAKLG